MKNEIFLNLTNGNPGILLHYAASGKWYAVDCAPTGRFGDVSILQDDDANYSVSDICAALAVQAAEYFPEEPDFDSFEVTEYAGFTADQVAASEESIGCEIILAASEEA